MLNAATARADAGDETGLIVRAKAGDAAAFTRLIERRQDGLYRTAWAILRQDADASDALQDACVNAWRELPRLRDTARFDAWLSRIVVNRCRTMLRARRRLHVREIEVDALADAAVSSSTLAGVDTIADSDAVRRAFLRLGGDQRALITLYHVEDRSIRDVAAILGVPEGTVKWRLSRARAALTAALARENR